MSAGDTMQGARRPDGTQVHELAPGEYAFACEDPQPDAALWICVPSGDHGHIDPALWSVTVEEDATVTVSPSIWSNKHASPPGWHGYLERGVWREV